MIRHLHASFVCACLLVGPVVLFSGGSVHAGSLLTLIESGTFSASSTLGGVAFAAPTLFTFQATFDPTVDLDPLNGESLFDATVTFTIAGHGTFTSDPGAGVKVMLSDPSLGTFTYGAGIGKGPITGFSAGLAEFFFIATPDYDADAPVPSVLSVLESSGAAVPFVIPLIGAGDLVIMGLDGAGSMAQISAAVPEPSALALGLIAGAFALGGAWWREKRAPIGRLKLTSY